MLLQTFEYLAAGILRAWWADLALKPWAGKTPEASSPHLHNRAVIIVKLA